MRQKENSTQLESLMKMSLLKMSSEVVPTDFVGDMLLIVLDEKNQCLLFLDENRWN